MSDGISPRKQMAMGKKDSGASGVDAFPGGRSHPDAAMGVRGELSDANRGVGAPVGGGAGQMPAQSAPDHGPHHERQLGFNRDGKA